MSEKLPTIIYPNMDPVKIGYTKARRAALCEKLGLPTNATDNEIDQVFINELIDISVDLGEMGNKINHFGDEISKIKADLDTIDAMTNPRRVLGHIASFFSLRK